MRNYRTGLPNNRLTYVLLFFLFVACSCSSLSNQGLEESNRIINKSLLLEVLSETSETVYPKGKILELRLYNDKNVEFDYYPPNTPDRIGLPFIPERKTAKLFQEDFDEIKSLLCDSALLNSANVYPPKIKRVLDATIKKSLTLNCGNQEKAILLEENDSHLHFEEKVGVYPTSLIKLLAISEKINKKLRIEINSESR